MIRHLPLRTFISFVFCLAFLAVSVAELPSASADCGHCKAQAAPADQPPADHVPVVAGYKKGFFIRSPHKPFEVKIGARLQARYTFEALDGEQDESAFSIPRGRISFKGHAFTEALKYKFQAEFGKGNVVLKDFYADYAAMPGRLQIRVGQWQRPFSRQHMTSSSKLELVDRAITEKAFVAGRDIGVAIHNNYEKSPRYEWALGVFNGTGEKPSLSGSVEVDPATGSGSITKGSFSNVPDQLHPAIVLRLGYNHGGIKGYSEGDLEGGPLRFALGASGVLDLDLDDDNSSAIRGEVDAIIKLQGFSASAAFYLATAQSGDGFGDQSFAAWGAHVQTGYVLAGMFQPVLAYALLNPDGGSNNTHEASGGLSIYFFKHNLKLQIDGGARLSQTSGDDMTDIRVRTQLQLNL